eukprot:jgi/Chrzof1/3580/Cz13g01060.t1
MAFGGNMRVLNDNHQVWNGKGAGAGLHVRGFAEVTLFETEVSSNLASRDGGGLYTEGDARVVMSNGTFSNNHAVGYGGGTYANGNASITVGNGSIFSGNRADYGGGVYADGNASISVANSSTLSHNGATHGGGVYADGNARIMVGSSSTFSHNGAILNELEGWGGGAYAGGFASITVTNNSTFSDNRATYGGGVYAEGNASITVGNSSTFSNNSAIKDGGGVYADGSASIMVGNSSTFSNNTASNGGGLSCQLNSTCELLDSYICHHTVAGVGAGLSIRDNVTALIRHSTLLFNRASQGGAIHATSPMGSTFTLKISNKSHIACNNALNGGGLYLQGGLTTIGPGVNIEGNAASTGGGVYLMTSCISCTASLHVSPDAHISNNTADSAGGIYKDSSLSTINEADARQAATNNSALFGADLLSSQCVMGEVFKGRWCERCGNNLYSLNPKNTDCDVCPAHANCTGGTVISPAVGYWHSSNYSTQIHKCPNPKACSQGGGIDKTSLDRQCAQGHTGNLCGKCVSNDTTTYGFTGAFTCSQCLAKGTMIALFVVSAVFMLLLNIVTVHFTYMDNLEGVYRSDVWPSDVIKILVLYLQYLIIISTAPLEWPKSLTAVFFAISWVFAASTSHAVSLDCIYSPSDVPLAIKRLLTYLVGPFVIAGAVVIVYCLVGLGRAAVRRCSVTSQSTTSRSLWDYVSRRVPAIMLVVLYAFFYPSLVKVGWSMFACCPIDDPTMGVYRQHLEANGSYWVYDIQEPCWSKNKENYHFIWALSLGIPTFLVFCIAVPVGIIGCLRVNKHKLGQLSFRTHFGFLYRNYTERCCWWEGVIATQTVFLVAISVFSSILGVYYELLLFCAMFAVIIIIHQLFVPMRVKKLYLLQLAAYMCLLTVCFVSLSFLALDPHIRSPDPYKEAAGALLLVQNVAFFCWGVFHLVMALKGPVATFISLVNQRLWRLMLKGKGVGAVRHNEK